VTSLDGPILFVSRLRLAISQSLIAFNLLAATQDRLPEKLHTKKSQD
jgi:hypothetical protein